MKIEQFKHENVREEGNQNNITKKPLLQLHKAKPHLPQESGSLR